MTVIRYSITKDGQIVLDFDGFRGKACVEEFDKILKALKDNFGIEVDAIKRDYKPEYYVEQEEVIEQ